MPLICKTAEVPAPKAHSLKGGPCGVAEGPQGAGDTWQFVLVDWTVPMCARGLPLGQDGSEGRYKGQAALLTPTCLGTEFKRVKEVWAGTSSSRSPRKYICQSRRIEHILLNSYNLICDFTVISTYGVKPLFVLVSRPCWHVGWAWVRTRSTPAPEHLPGTEEQIINIGCERQTR